MDMKNRWAKQRQDKTLNTRRVKWGASMQHVKDHYYC